MLYKNQLEILHKYFNRIHIQYYFQKGSDWIYIYGKSWNSAISMIGNIYNRLSFQNVGKKVIYMEFPTSFLESRLTIVSREAKKKQAVRDEQVSYLHVALL